MSHETCWEQSTPLMNFSPLLENVTTDVCIIGAGIAGMMTAYHLSREGKSVVVIDAASVGGGQTQNTTAHLTNAIDDRYAAIERWHGSEGAKLAAQSHSAAIDRIELIVTEEKIDCDFERLNGYLFAPPEHSPNLLDDELRAARAAGLTVEPLLRAPLPKFFTGPALCFPRQAQFHPMKFLHGLADAIVRRGGRIFNHTRVQGVEAISDETSHGSAGSTRSTPSLRVKIQGDIKITANDVVVATNSPINDMFVIHTKQAAYLTYVVGFPVARGSIEKALYWDALDPYHYVRLVEITSNPDEKTSAGATPSQQMLIVGGEDHKTGQADDSADRFARLATWARERFPVTGEPDIRWSGQVMETMDGLAFIGKNPMDNPHVYIATGDSGMGMTHGSIAGMLLTDLIIGRPNAWAALYDPTRKSVRAADVFLEENFNVMRQYATWVTPGEVASIDEIPAGHGAIMRHGLSKLAIYRDPHGAVHTRSAVCPHLGCLVNWNGLDKTWDCPCHGSRFDTDGQAICGPACSGLAPAETPVVIA